MSLEALRQTIPDYAKDVRINLSQIVGDGLLNDQRRWGALLAAAHATGFPPLIRAVNADAESRISTAAIAAAKSAAALMAMTNTYYRALHAMRNTEYATLRTSLRMNIFADPGVERGDFEFWSFVVSALNGCGACLDAHEEELRKRDWPVTHIQAGLRIAAVIAATAAVLRAEAA
jgi:lipoyl-dependent peroxiredoxin subunit D